MTAAERVREARTFDAVVADAILNLLDLRQQADAMDPRHIVLFADHMADLMQELRASHAAERAETLAEVREAFAKIPYTPVDLPFKLAEELGDDVPMVRKAHILATLSRLETKPHND